MFCSGLLTSSMRTIPSTRLAAAGPRVHVRAASSDGPDRGQVNDKLLPEADSSNRTPLQKLLRMMFTPGTGQVRTSLPPAAQRSWRNDIMLTSHVAFVPAILVAAARSPPLPELALLQSCVLLLSLAYHRNYERPGLLARGEGASAKLLFLYGTAQTFRSPDPSFLLINGACFAATLGSFVATNFNKALYERYHPIGLHIVPGVWSTSVAMGHTSLLPASLAPQEPLMALPWLQFGV